MVKGEAHWANASNPEIPAALAPVVAGVHSLHNFYKKPQLGLSQERGRITASPGAQPQVTFSDGTHALGPADYRVIYNANPNSFKRNQWAGAGHRGRCPQQPVW